MIRVNNQSEHSQALARIDALWSSAPGTNEAEELLALAEAVEAFEGEDLRAVLPPARLHVVIGYKLRELGWDAAELGRRLAWPEERVIAVLTGEESLAWAPLEELCALLTIDAQSFTNDVPAASSYRS